MRDERQMESPMVHGLVLAMVLGAATFWGGYRQVYESRPGSHRAAEQLPSRAPAAQLLPSRVVLSVVPASQTSTSLPRPARLTLARRPQPRLASWSACNQSLLDPDVLAVEQRDAEAFRTTRVLPTLFVPCCPKAGTTFINECVSAAFHPKAVCRSEDPAAWAGEQCAGKSFALGGARSSLVGMFHEAKEVFYFNKDVNKKKLGAARDLAILAGPPLPLCTWFMRKFGAPPPPSSNNGGRVGQREYWNAMSARPRVACNLSGTPPPKGTPYLDGNSYLPEGTWPGCRLAQLDPGARGRSDFKDGVQFKVAFPMAAELPAGRAMTYDMTPNYLCSSHALAFMKERYGPELAAKARFIVMLRDPVARAYSEFSMFRTWGWEKVASFSECVSTEIQMLRKCLRNDTLLLHPSALLQMPPAKVISDVMCCGSGDARQYVRNSMYETCIAGAYAHFRREQFMFIFAEDLREMPGAALMLKIEAFTGLTLLRDTSGAPSSTFSSRCDTGTRSGGGRALPNHQTKGKIPADVKKLLHRFFEPSYAALAALIRGSFQDEQPLARLRSLAEGKVLREDRGDLGGFGVDVSASSWARRQWDGRAKA